MDGSDAVDSIRDESIPGTETNIALVMEWVLPIHTGFNVVWLIDWKCGQEMPS